MKNLTLSEFQSYLASNKPACYVYSTANQKEIHSTLSGMARYANARVSLNTMRIMLYGNEGYLCLNRVQSVAVGDAENCDPVWIDVICTAFDGKKVKHSIMATNKS